MQNGEATNACLFTANAADTNTARSSGQSLYSAGYSLEEVLVQLSGSALLQIGGADDVEPGFEKGFWSDDNAWPHFDLDEVSALVRRWGELPQTAALPAGARLVDELAHPLVGFDHRASRGREMVAELRLRATEHRGPFLGGEPQHFL